MKYCTNCGNELLNLKDFCSKCGQKTQDSDYYLDENSKDNKTSIKDKFGDEEEVLNKNYTKKNESKSNFLKITLITIISTVFILYILNSFNNKYPDSQQEFLDLYCNVNWHISEIEIEKIYHGENSLVGSVTKSDLEEYFNTQLKDKNTFSKAIIGDFDDYIVEYSQSYDTDKGEYTYSINEIEVFKNPEGKFMFFQSISSDNSYGVVSGNEYTDKDNSFQFNSIINKISTEKVEIKSIFFFESLDVSVVFNYEAIPIEAEIDASYNLHD